MTQHVPDPQQLAELLDLAEMGLTAEQAYKIGRMTGDMIRGALSAGRIAAAQDVENMPTSLGDEGWNALADKAADAGYDRRTVLRRRKPEDNFTALTIEAAYQYGYREAARVARGLDDAPPALPRGEHVNCEHDPAPAAAGTMTVSMICSPMNATDQEGPAQ